MIAVMLLDEFAIHLFRLALVATVLLGVALIACRVMRRRSAAERHAVLVTTFLALLAAPALTGVLPTVALFDLQRVEERFRVIVPSVAIPEHVLDVDAASAPGTTPYGGPRRGIEIWLAEPAFYLLVIALPWPFAFAFLGGRILFGNLVARRLRSLPPVTNAGVLRRAGRMAAEMGIRRKVLLVISNFPTPLTTGILSPVIALPDDFSQWSSRMVDCALRHELAHVRRVDVLWQGIAHFVRALLWFHPLAWIAARRLCEMSESACDDEVVLGGTRSADYAEVLLRTTLTAARIRQPRYFSMIAMSYGPDAGPRLRRLLSARCAHTPCTNRFRIVALLSALALLLPFGTSGRSRWSYVADVTAEFEAAADSRQRPAVFNPAPGPDSPSSSNR